MSNSNNYFEQKKIIYQEQDYTTARTDQEPSEIETNQSYRFDNYQQKYQNPEPNMRKLTKSELEGENEFLNIQKEISHGFQQKKFECSVKPEIKQLQEIQFSQSKYQQEDEQLKILAFENGLLILTNLSSRIQKTLYRLFMNNLLFYIFKRLDFLLKHAQNQKELVKLKQPETPWLYKKLFQKPNPTEEQIMYKQFLNHCATRIQCNFKGYLSYKRHRIIMTRLKRMKQIFTGVTKGWKVRQILKSKKLKPIRDQILNIHNQINTCIINQEFGKKLNYLNKELTLNTELFSEKFQYLYRTGGWVFERTLNPSKIIIGEKVKQSKQKTTKDTTARQEVILNEVKNQKINHQKTKRKREFKQQRGLPQQQKPLEIKNNSLASLDDRPIKSNGTYSIEEVEIKNPNQLSNPIQQPNTEQTKPEKQITKRLVKKEKYDPRKAIEQQKKRKLELVKTNQQKKPFDTTKEFQIKQNQVPVQLVQKKPEKKSINKINRKKSKNHTQQNLKIQKNTPESIQLKSKPIQLQKDLSERGKSGRPSMISEKSAKKIQSKVNCWGKKQSLKIKEERNQYRKQYQQNQIQQNFEPPKIESSPRVTRQVEYITTLTNNITQSQEYKQIQTGPKKIVNQEKYEKITKNMQRIMQKMAEKKEQKKNMYRPIQELVYTYETQYQTRYSKIMPKLERLSQERNQQEYAIVPIILNNSFFANYVDNNLQFYQNLLIKLEKNYRGIFQN